VHRRPKGANFKEIILKGEGWSTAKGFRN